MSRSGGLSSSARRNPGLKAAAAATRQRTLHQETTARWLVMSFSFEEARGHFGSFHSRTVLSRLPDRPRLPSDETATPQTQLVWPKNRHTSLQLSTSHS